jgi:hypothetical protein
MGGTDVLYRGRGGGSRVNREEQTMRVNFGKEYDDYTRSTHRLFPKIRRGS